MTRKRKIVFIIIGLVVILLASTWIMNIFSSPINFIEKTTNIEFPRGISQVDQYDNLEVYVVAHVKLPDSSVQSFAEQHHFSPTNPSPRIAVDPPIFRLEDVIFGVERLKIENQTIPDDADVLFVSGKVESNCWRYVLDQNSGRLWVSVMYPDMSGDLACE